jgi:protein required for attachment to host cells
MKNILLIVANASRARLFRVHGGILLPLEALAHPASRAKVADLVSDRPGRAFDDSSGGPRRAGMEPHTDPHEVELLAFARQVARRAAIHARRGHYPEVLLVAPPRFLGRVKLALDPGVAKRIVASVSHDYTLKDEAELVAMLETLGVHATLPVPA